MKKLGNGKGRRVHPVPPPGAALPAAVMAMAAVLTAEDQEVLAYLLSGGGGRWREQRRRRAHPPELECGCFGCYKSFWARWDASPNRHVIHRIIDAVEESLEARECDRGGGGGRRRRRSGRGGNKGAILAPNATAMAEAEEAAADSSRVEGKGSPALDAEHFPLDDGDDYDDDDDGDEEDEHDDEEEQEMNESNNNNKSKNSVRRFMSFIGETVWGVWN